MKLFDKVKNMFTEEVEEEVKVEKVPTKVKKDNIPDVVNNFDEVKIEKEEIKKPIFFTDHDFEDLEPKTKPKKERDIEPRDSRDYRDDREYKVNNDYRETKDFKESREDYSKRETFRDKYKDSKRENYSNIDSNPDIYRGNQTNVYNDPYKEKKEERVFKPTPIISPVYGILDKNYHKEDIVSKKETNYSSVGTISNVSTIDEVRQKAYGTLEDELENTLFGSNSILFNNKTEESKETKEDFFDELETEAKPDFRENKVRDFKKIEKSDFNDDNEKEIGKRFKTNFDDDFKNELDNDFDNEEQDKKIRDLEEITMDIGKELNSLLNKKENLKTPEVKKPVKEEIDEDDLFNLIDTMYEGDE